MPEGKTIGADIDADETIRTLRALVQIPGTTGQERDVAEYVAGRLRAFGARVTVDAYWNVLGDLGPGDGQGVLLLTHTDSGPAGTMTDPYNGAILDGAPFGKDGQVVYGRGSCAPKAALAAMLGAMAVLAPHAAALPGRVQLAAVTKDLSANHEGVREADALGLLREGICIAGEPSHNAIVLGARGIAHYAVEFEGVPAHWGRPQDAANPLFALAAFLPSIERLELPSDPALGAATISAFEVASSAVAPRTPETCCVMLDRRVLPGESPEAIRDALQALADRAAAARPRITARVRQVSGMSPYRVSPSAPVVRRLEHAVQAALGRPAEHTYITFASNAGYLIREHAMPSVALGPGHIGDAGEREHVSVSQVLDAAKVYAAAAAAGAS